MKEKREGRKGSRLSWGEKKNIIRTTPFPILRSNNYLISAI
jgi:hypothetical protein